MDTVSSLMKWLIFRYKVCSIIFEMFIILDMDGDGELEKPNFLILKMVNPYTEFITYVYQIRGEPANRFCLVRTSDNFYRNIFF